MVQIMAKTRQARLVRRAADFAIRQKRKKRRHSIRWYIPHYKSGRRFRNAKVCSNSFNRFSRRARMPLFAFPAKHIVPTNIKRTLGVEKQMVKFDTNSGPIAIDSCASYSLTYQRDDLTYQRDDFIPDTIKEVKRSSCGELTFPFVITTTLGAMCKTNTW